MSRLFALWITWSSAEAGSAPGWENTIMFSRNTIRVGMERILNDPASSCWSSVFTLANSTSGYFSAAASKIGAKLRHGPHQGAQKSTSTILSPVTVWSKLALVSSIVVIMVLRSDLQELCSSGRDGVES